uniref:26S proteasome non-ATPase regulatory subunit 6 n=1 Tax=Ditylenchus dipsaci TaxID=166011 RepID=A0A915DDV9_9BILA
MDLKRKFSDMAKARAEKAAVKKQNKMERVQNATAEAAVAAKEPSLEAMHSKTLHSTWKVQSFTKSAFLTALEIEELEKEIKSFQADYENFPVWLSRTPKYHWLVVHVIPHVKKFRTWGKVSEQPIECLHHNINKDSARNRLFDKNVKSITPQDDDDVLLANNTFRMTEKKPSEPVTSAKTAKPKVEDDFDEDIISKIPIWRLRSSTSYTNMSSRMTGLLLEPKSFCCCFSTLKRTKWTLKDKNAKRLKEIDDEIKDAEENLANLIKEAAVEAFRNTFEKTVGIGYRIDLIFNLIRVGLFFLDNNLVSTNIAKAKDLMEQGGDWDRKNRLRCYEGLYKMATRDMKGAAELFLEAVPTFGSYELMTYENLVFYAVITTMFALDRPDLYKKVVRCNEVQEQLNGGGESGGLIPVKSYLDAFYGCKYDQFYKMLGDLEVERLKVDRYLEPHYQFYARAMRLKAYKQFLTPYKTVRLEMMAKDFGVSKEFIDKELHAQVSAGQLNCRIDAVHEVIEMNHSDSKNDLYKSVVRDGDILLNRVQKLARVINT